MILVLLGVLVFSFGMANYQNFKTITKNQADINRRLEIIIKDLNK